MDEHDGLSLVWLKGLYCLNKGLSIDIPFLCRQNPERFRYSRKCIVICIGQTFHFEGWQFDNLDCPLAPPHFAPNSIDA